MTIKTWQDVENAVCMRIIGREYRPGDKLPKDTEFAEELGVSRLTVQRAMNALAERGIVKRKRKGGTRVFENPITRTTLDIPLIAKEVMDRGQTYSYHLRFQEQKTAPPALSAIMNTKSNRVLYLEAVHFGDNRPFLYEERMISLETVPEIVNVDFANISANSWLVQNKPYTRCDVKFYAVSANKHLGKMMECSLSSALFVLERMTWAKDRLITSVKTYYQEGYYIQTSTDRKLL